MTSSDSPGLLLAPLLKAGWRFVVSVEDYDEEAFDFADDEAWGAVLGRGLMQLEVEYFDGTLSLGPRLVPSGEDGFDFLDSEESVDFDMSAPLEDRVKAVEDLTGELGLLDVTNVGVVSGSDISASEVWLEFMSILLLVPVAERRQITRAELVEELTGTAFDEFLVFLALSGRLPAPEAVPPAAALGIALCGWRNTAVEDAHSLEDGLTDVVMAKLSIGATRIALDHCSVNFIDWLAIERELLDVSRELPDGRRVRPLFGESWQKAAASVRESLEKLWTIETVIGPLAMVAYMSMLGSTSYTSHWWGTGWWARSCRTVLQIREEAGVLPSSGPLHAQDDLLPRLISSPDALPDDALWSYLSGHKVEDGRWLPGLGDVALPPPVVVRLDLD